MEHIQRIESPNTAGLVALRFYAGGGDPTARNKSDDIHFSFASLRQKPNYTSIYVQGIAEDPSREEEFPCRVSYLISNVG